MPSGPSGSGGDSAATPDDRFDATPADALAAVANHRGPLVVDFDETLLLANSTSLFIDSASPSVVAYLLIKVVDLVHRFTRKGEPDRRDAWRVRAIMLAMPWVVRRWRRRAPATVTELLNRPLVEALAGADGPIVIATMGFTPIVAPLVAASDLGSAQLVAVDPRAGGDRERVKFQGTEEVLGDEGLAGSLVVTDSLADRALLEAAEVPLRVTWPEVRQVRTFDTTYFPGRYLEVKRPQGSYATRILLEDISFWVLASIWLVDEPVTHTAGLLVLALSFWAVYEYGYVDNDRIAEVYEPDPMLTSTFHRRRLRFAVWKPLTWAAITGALGVWIINWPDPEPVDFARWGGLLVATLITFVVYNRVDKQSRVFLYPLLQLLRSGAFLVVVVATPIVVAAVAIKALFRWVPYFIYRTRSAPFPSDDLSAHRLLVFLPVAVVMAAEIGWSELVTPTTLSVAAWMLIRARTTLPNAIRGAHRIDR